MQGVVSPRRPVPDHIGRPPYAENGVPEYWIVDVLRKRIEVHSDPDGTRFRNLRTYAPGESIRLLAFPDVEIRVDDLLR